ncbi:DUF1186 domain-containing protein [Herbivorax sp. ANBcel31]|uniref:DUF1186 domain-containing protein n=1 Tax=Herbivorax sp. ANBcel31 TaxID=3069754 RepID=UPI0027B71FD5|nr:DUF1186 domain-containing protein [Herbivorax sp. ANBcel31]MDQ2086178.1 DUF1186 domain-containing protein [Herbivorax sp. ANBcel31]
MRLKIFKGYERFDDHYPSEQVKYALENKEEAIPELLEILEYTVNNAESLFKDNKYLIHFPAIYLLAYFRENRAYREIIQFLGFRDEVIYGLLGDTVTDNLKNILASVCDGDINPLKKIIENSLIDEFVRCEALEALLVLLSEGELKREELVFYFKELMNGKLEKDYTYIWEFLPTCCSLIHPKGLIDDIEQATKDGKIDSFLVDWLLLENNAKRSSKDVLRELKENESYFFIDKEDVFSLEEWVGGFKFDDEYYDDDDWFEDEGIYYLEDEEIDEYELKKDKYYDKLINIPFVKDSKEELNSLCPCGSGKKYKKCCFWKERNKF